MAVEVGVGVVVVSDVKSSRPKWWPRDQNFGLGIEALASVSVSASNIWLRPGLDLVVLLCKRGFFGQKSCKIQEGILLIFRQ